MTDFGDTVWRKAAKVHRCQWCGQDIGKGDKHAYFAGKWDGEWQNWRMHSECYDDAATNKELSEGFMPYEHERPTLAVRSEGPDQ